MTGKRHICGILIVLFLTGCTQVWHVFPFKGGHKKPSVASVQQRHPVTQTRRLPVFTRISVKGTINVRLHTQANTSQMVATGDTRDLANMQTYVSGGTLSISMGRGYPQYGYVTVDIYTRYLTVFDYAGRGLVTAANLRTSSLDLNLNNIGNTQLQGQIGLHRLHVGGTGKTQISGINGNDLRVWANKHAEIQLAGMTNAAQFDVSEDARLSLYWVKSETLTLKAKDRGMIQLAGIADRLEVELWGGAKFYGRYLRAEQSFIKTHDRALAEIATLRHQHTLATGKSNIYFYNVPLSQVDFMAHEGAVLDLRGWERYYDAYAP